MLLTNDETKLINYWFIKPHAIARISDDGPVLSATGIEYLPWRANNGTVLLVKCLQQRDNTLVRLMQRLAMLQRHYILEGDAAMVPLTRAQLACELEVHESTISRAVAGKAVQLPNKKIVPLAKWFDRSLNVRTALLHIIAQERQPLSDTEIVGLLADQGFAVARRTVAKYRSMEGILPARLRHNTAVLIAHE